MVRLTSEEYARIVSRNRTKSGEKSGLTVSKIASQALDGKYRIGIKPLSVNEAYTGKRHRTPEYRAFSTFLSVLLPDIRIPDGPLEIRFVFGVSNAGADWDNPIKPFQDVIAKHYGFDDKRIFKGSGEKRIVPKGSEFVAFSIKSFAIAKDGV